MPNDEHLLYRQEAKEWGRIGRPGQLRHVPYPTADEAKEALARQRRAKERLGYRRASRRI